MNAMDSHKNGLPFLKMHGLGNDFVIIDARDAENPVTAAMARAIGHRYFGVGFDQLAVLTTSDVADVDVAFWNSDGSTAGACGNASRCIGRLLIDETGKASVSLRTERGILPVVDVDGDVVSVNMGQPQLDWREVPLARDVDLNALPIDGEPGAAGMGNPHCVFVVDDVDAVDLAKVGPIYEHHELFPERTNVEYIQILDRENIRMRVWERGGMITLACGSGACAVAVVAHQKGLTERKVTIHLEGGPLDIDWRDDGVWMTGATQLVFSGVLSSDFLDTIK
ncbi:MAG: diaminopimelate epimerase [Amylibacter sp.]|jgi:diaminopimelate epimerase|nr:diaminopimelate epimerase [Amylibacter sp.]